MADAKIFGIELNTINLSVMVFGAFIILVIAFFLMTPDMTKLSVVVSEAPLEPNVPLQLKQGEEYTYSEIYHYENASQPVQTTFRVLGGRDCVLVKGKLANQSAAEISGCLDPVTGKTEKIVLTQGEETRELNGTLGFFQPWMLSIEENWTWQMNVSKKIENVGVLETEVWDYAEIGEEKVKGRDTYKVELNVTGIAGNKVIDFVRQVIWVDKEKRIIVKAESDISETELVSAPFPLD